MVDLIKGEARVNVFTAGNQQDSHMATLTGGGYVSVWQTTNQNGSGTGLVAQLYNDFGERVGLPVFVEQDTVGAQTIGGVAGTADGGFVVTWRGSDSRDIQARQFDASAQPVADEFTVNTERYSAQYQPEVAGLTGGGFVVTWVSHNDETYTWDIRAQRYDAAGSAQGTEFTVNSTTAGYQEEPEVAALTDGGFVVVWRDESGADGAGSGIFAQRYNASGVAQGSETQVNTTTASSQNEPDVVALTGGGYVVVWRDDGGADGSAGGIFAQIYDANGAAVGNELSINQVTNSWQWQPAVGATSDGGFFVAWYSYTTANGSTYDIVGRHFDATGAALTDDVVITQDGNASDAQRPDVVGLANGAIVVSWDYPANSGDGDGRAVYQRLLQIDGAGVVIPEAPILEAVDPHVTFTETQLQSAPQMLDASGAVAVSGPADFDGGRLTVSRISARVDEDQYNTAAGQDQDVLGLRDQGTGPGQVGVSGATVSFGGVTIGTIVQNGTDRAPLQIEFNANADRTAVEAVVENLTYANASDDPAERVELVILIEDGDGGASEPAKVVVNVTPEADAPVSIFDHDIDVNTFSNSTQQQPAVAELSDGGWVVMWESYSQDTLIGNSYGIVGQRYDASGALVGGEFLVNTQRIGGQQQVDVAGIDGGPNAGGFVATWYDGSDTNGRYIKAQVFGADNQPVGGEIVVPATSYSTQQQPSVATNPDGSFVIVWTSYRQATNSYDIVAQRFDASGARVGSEIVVNTDTASTQDLAEVVTLTGGGFAVSWTNYDQGGTNSNDISTRVFAADGTAVSGEVTANSATAGDQTHSDIAALAGGGYVVVWEDRQGLDGNSYGIYAQMFDAAGGKLGTQFLVNENTQGTQYEPAVTALPGGGFSVSYTTTASVFGGSYNVAIQHYDASGNRVDGERLVNQDTASSQYQPAIAGLSNGDMVVAWRDDSGRDGSGAGVVMQIVGDPANYAGAQNNPVVSVAQAVVTFDESDVNAAPQLLFSGVDVGDADSADFDGGTLSVFRAGAATTETMFDAPDDATQDNLGLRDQGTGAGQIGVSGNTVSFGGVAIGTLTSDGANGTPLTVSLNANATPEAVEALLQNVTYANPSDDPLPSRDFRIALTDGDGGSSASVNVQLRITPEIETITALAGELQVNSFEHGRQANADTAALATGGYIAVWDSYDQDAGVSDNGVFAQRFDATGQPVGDEFQINAITDGYQNTPRAAGLNAADGGGYAVVWADTSNNAGYIKAQVFNDDGSVRQAEFQVETEVYSTQSVPAITAVPGGFLVVWASVNNESNTNDIRGQYFDGSGVAQGGEFTINTATAGAQTNPELASDASGNVVVVWEDQSGQDGASYGVFAQRYDSSGNAVGGEFQVNTTTSGNQYQPQVTYLADGRFVVTWRDDSGIDGSGSGVMAQIFAADGTTIGSEFLVNQQVSSEQYPQDIQALSDGGFAIAYDDASGADGSGWGVFVQRYNADGSRRDGPVQINEETSSSQTNIRITEISDGIHTGIAAVWQSSNSAPAGDGSSEGVFTRVFGQAGTLQPTNVLPDIEDLDHVVYFAAGTIGTAQVIDDAVRVIDPDSTDFNGGTVELRYVSHHTSTDDQLSVVSGKGITTSGSDVLYGGTVIGSVDATDNGVNGADLVINLTAAATPQTLRYLMEQLGFASANPVAGSERHVSVRITDGDGAISDGDAIRIDIENTVSTPTMSLTDVDNQTVTETDVESGVRLDGYVDFDDSGANGFDGGYVDLTYRAGIYSRVGAPFETVSVANDGTGTNQIGVSGTDITFEGTVIGSIDATRDGQGGNNLRVNLVAAATADAVDALIEALVYTNTSDGPASQVRFHVQVRDAGGNRSGNAPLDLTITPEVDSDLVALGGEMQVNAFTEGTQRYAAVTELSDGGFVVTWESYNQDSSDGYDYGVYQQRYSAAGEPVGPEVLVNQTTTGTQDQADVAGLTGGGWVTVWQGPGSSGQDVFARLFDANGVGGAEFQLNLQDSWSQYDPSVTALANGNFVVTWDSETSGGAGDGNSRGVIGRVFQADGTPVSGSDLVLNNVTSGSQYQSDVIGLTGGGFVAVWTSGSADGNSNAVAYRLFDNAGAALGGEAVANTTTVGAQDNPSVAQLTDGGFVITWQSPDGSSDGVFMQRFDATGAKVGGETQVNDYQSSSQGQPDVTGTTDGGWVVTFADASGNDGSGWGVFAQRYDAAGNRVDGNFVVNEQTQSAQDYPAIATLTDGRVVVAWDSNTSGTAGDGNAEGVFVRLLGTQPQVSSADPAISGLADVTLDEAALNAGYTAVFAPGSVAVSDPDSADLSGGRLMVHVVRDYAAAEQFRSPDDFDQDVMTFAGSGIQIVGTDVRVGGVSIGTLEQDGQAGNGLQVLLNAGATAERVEVLLGGLNYRNPSNDPQDQRVIEVTLSDGDGGVTQHQTFGLSITPQQDGFEKVGDEAQVNSYTESTQHQSDVAGLSGGGHVAVWSSHNQDDPGSGDYGIFAQRYDVDGQPVGPEFQVNTTFAGWQYAPTVAGLSDGTFVVGWEGNGVGDSSGVFAQRFAADGTPLGTEFRLNDATSGSESDVQIAAAPGGGFMAVWYDSSPNDVQGRIYDNSGTAVGSEFTVSNTGASNSYAAEVAALTNGTYAVTWYDQSTQDVFVRLIDGTGTPVAPEQSVTSSLSGQQYEPDIAALSGGGFALVWVDNASLDGSGRGVYAQLFSAAGAAQGDAFLVNEAVSSSQDQPKIVGTPDGGFVVAYRDAGGVDGSSSGVIAQQFDASGNRVDGQLIVNTENSSNQDQPAIDVLANGAVVVSWTSNTSGTAGDGSGQGVFSQILGDPADFNLDGRPQLDGLNGSVTYLENALNVGPQLLDANNAVAVSDSDSADFDGGFIRVDNVISTRGYENQVSAPDNYTQDNLGLRQAQGITISGGDVFVDGTQVGTITRGGVAGDPFEIALNANADVAIVELLVENLTYRNTSDDPDPARVVRVQIADGDGGVSDPQLVTINVTAEVDGATRSFGERQANTETASSQNASEVARLDDGGFVIVWQSSAQDEASTWGVFGQRFDANGNPVDAEFQVNSTTTNSQYQPTVTGLDTGGWVVSWMDDGGLDGSGNGVFMQRYAADGSAAGGETRVNTYTNSTQYQPAVTVLENGDYVVTWTSYNNTAGGGSQYDVWAQVYQANGTAIGTEFLVNTQTQAQQDTPTVAALETGGFAISWTSQTSGPAGDGSSDGVFYRVYDDSAANYAALGSEMQVNSYSDGAQNAPQIVGLKGGGYVVVWQSGGQDGSNTGVFAQQFDANGAPVSQEFRVNDQRISTQNQPDVAALSNGGYVVVFSDSNGTDGSGWGVYAQQYAANGNRIDGAIQVNTETSSTQYQPSVAALDNGGFVVSWTSNTSGTAGDGSGDGVFYQIFSNTAPVVADVNASTAEDTNLVFTAQIFEDGFTDDDGQPLAAIRIDVLPSAGTLEFQGSPIAPGQVVTVAQLDAGDLVYIPPADFNGTLDFGWTGSDGASFAAAIAQTNITVTPVNDPVGLAAIADQTISEGTNLNIQAALSDPDSDTYRITVNYGEGDADVVFNSSSKTPSLINFYDVEGSYTVNLSVDDQNGSVESLSFTVTVENAAPVARNDSLSTNEDTVATRNLFGNDYDPGGDPYGVTQINGVAYTAGDDIVLPSGATVSIGANGALSYDPTTSASLQALADGQSATDSFTYTITDDGGLSSTAQVSVFVSGADDNVSARDDAFTVDEDSTLNGSVFDDNGNGPDTDPEGDALSVISVNGNAGLVGAPITLPGGGVLRVNADGSVSFAAGTAYDELNVGDTRDVGFSYIVEEAGSGLTASADGTITITGVNDDPVANGDSSSTAFNTAVNINVLSNDYDVDQGDSFAVTSVGTPSHGTAVIELDGTVTYTPDAGYVGADSFTYEITDANGGTSSATVNVQVQGSNAPNAQNDQVSTDEDSALSGNVFADNGNGADTDPEGDDFDVTAVNGQAASVGTQIALASGALLTLNADGTFDYDPSGQFETLGAGDTALDGFSYTITDDNGGSDTASVTVTVNGVNDGPTAADDSYSTGYQTALTIAASGVLANDSDIDGDALTAALNTDPTHGSVTVNADGSFTYTPDAGFSGADSFTYDADDGNGGVATATVTINVGTNGAPVTGADSYSVDEDSVLNVGAAAGVLVNDSDPDGDSLSAVLVSDVSNGTLTLNGDGSFDYTPDADFNGTDSFTYNADDGNGGTTLATVTITVDAVNDAPVAVDDAVSVDEDAAAGVVIAPLANDTDVDGDSLTVINIDTPTMGQLIDNGNGTYTYIGNPNANGVETIGYTVSDGNGGTDTGEITVTVNAVNDAPDAVDDSYTAAYQTALTVAAGVGVLANDTDVDGDALTAALNTDAANGSVVMNLDGSFTYTPDAGFSGVDSFTYDADDGNGGVTEATVTVTVAGPGNRAPVPGVVVESYFEDDNLAQVDLLAGATDPDGDTLSVQNATAVASDGRDLTGVLSISGNTVSLTPMGNFEELNEGDAVQITVSYEITDGLLSVPTTATLTVNGVNDAPVLAPAGPFSMAENLTAVGTVTASDVDNDDATLTYQVSGGDDGALFTINADGDLSFVTAPDFEAPGDLNGDNVYQVEITVSDGDLTDSQMISVTVTDVDEGVVFNQITGTNGSDYLRGTSGADEIRSLGGAYDRMVGGADTDHFVFGSETQNGTRERDVIMDYEVGVDCIVLEDGASVASVQTTGYGALVVLNGDLDAIYVRGAGVTGDNIKIIEDTTLDAI